MNPTNKPKKYFFCVIFLRPFFQQPSRHNKDNDNVIYL